jgi:hypothetical protein
MAILAREPISSLYSDLVGYLNADKESSHDRDPDRDPPSAAATVVRSVTLVTADLNLEESVTTFFASLFPLVYHHAVNPHLRDFSGDYKSCLRATISEIQPFGDVPRQVAQGISKTMEATRVLLQALNLGAEVLNSTDTLLMTDSIDVSGAQWSECHTALLRMSYCPTCQGLTRPGLKPCSGYCLNVLRGCLTQHASELDLPWNGFVEATERLVVAVRGHDAAPSVVLNVEEIIRSLDTKISEAIMYAMENGPSLERKVGGPALTKQTVTCLVRVHVRFCYSCFIRIHNIATVCSMFFNQLTATPGRYAQYFMKPEAEVIIFAPAEI